MGSSPSMRATILPRLVAIGILVVEENGFYLSCGFADQPGPHVTLWLEAFQEELPFYNVWWPETL